MRARHDLRTSTTTSSLQARRAIARESNDEHLMGITVSCSRLVLYHSEIGTHRDRHGFGEVFKFRTLYNLPFTKLAAKVKDAYEGKRVPSHHGWSDQYEALQWFVKKGRDAIYALDTKPIRVTPCPYQHYYLFDGHHRALALYILGEKEIRAKLGR